MTDFTLNDLQRAAIERTDGEEVGERVEIDVEGAEQIAQQKAACGL